MWSFFAKYLNMNIPIETDFAAYSYFADMFDLKKFNTAEEYVNSPNFRETVKPQSATFILNEKRIKDYVFSTGGMVNNIWDESAYLIRVEEKKVIEYYKRERWPHVANDKIQDSVYIRYDVDTRTIHIEYLLYSIDNKEMIFKYGSNSLIRTNYYHLPNEKNNPDLIKCDLIKLGLYINKTIICSENELGKIYEFFI